MSWEDLVEAEGLSHCAATAYGTDPRLLRARRILGGLRWARRRGERRGERGVTAKWLSPVFIKDVAALGGRGERHTHKLGGVAFFLAAQVLQ